MTMVPLARLWVPILLATLAVFIVSSLVHMVVKWHNSDYRRLPNEDEVREAIQKGHPEPGQYVMPYCMDMKQRNDPEMIKKYMDGPLGMVYLMAPGLPPMGKSMAAWVGFNLVIAGGVAYLLSRTLAPGTPCRQVFRVAATLCFLIHAGGAVPGAIWMGKPWRVAWKEVGDALAYGLASGAAFAWLWPR